VCGSSATSCDSARGSVVRQCARQQCAALRAAVYGSAAVCASVCGNVRQCAQQCVVVRTASVRVVLC
jgi:hypothetical protein